MKAADFGGYVIAQVVGAIAAAFVAKMAMPGAFDSVKGGIPALGTGISAGTGILLEVIATLFLVGVIWGTAVSKKAPALGALLIGLTVTLDILAIGPVTGAAMNPARYLGPAVASGNFTDIAVYMIGPCLGALIGAFAWEYMLGEKKEASS
jgi:glycerol uptake facilitator-like aquaporin